MVWRRRRDFKPAPEAASSVVADASALSSRASIAGTIPASLFGKCAEALPNSLTPKKMGVPMISIYGATLVLIMELGNMIKHAILASGLVLFPFWIGRASGQAQPAGGGSDLHFRLPEAPDFRGVLDSADSSGACRAHFAVTKDEPEYEHNLAEGHFLVVAGKFADGIPQQGGVGAAEVTRVLKDNVVQFRVRPAAAKKFKAGEDIWLVRPICATTDDMNAVADYVEIAKSSNPNSGVMAGSDFALLAAEENRLRQIGLALASYATANGRFPPAAYYNKKGQPTVSWRVLILPYMEQGDLFKKFDLEQPWDSARNKPLLAKMPAEYRDNLYGESTAPYTCVAAVTGPGTIFPIPSASAQDGDDAIAKTGSRLRDITDGTSKTLLAGSVGPAEKIPWTKPVDVLCDEKFQPLGKPGSFATPYKTQGQSVGLFLFADGHVSPIANSIELDVFKALTTRAGSEPIDDEKIPSPKTSPENFQILLTVPRAPGSKPATLSLKALDKDRP